MKNLIIKILPALAFCCALAGVTISAQQQSTPTAPAATTTTASTQTKATRRRATTRTAKPKPKPSPSSSTAQTQSPAATPATTASPAASASPVTEVPSTAEAVAEEPTTETPPVATSAEEILPPAKIEAEPSREERLREELIAVDQMVSQGKKQEALAKLQLLAAEDRFDPRGFYNIANAFARLDATDGAISAYRKAIEQRKGRYARASNNLGVILLRQGFWDQAYDAFLDALRTENFHYAEASYNLGRLYAARGEMDRASREWRRAVSVDPKHSAAVQALGSVRGLSTTPEDNKPVAAPTKTSAVTSGSSTKFNLNSENFELLQRARTAHEQGRYAEAVENFQRVIARTGGYFSPANLELSYSLIELRRNDEAIASLLLVSEKDGARFPISYYHLGRLYEQRNDLKLAEENYLRATQAHQTDNAQFLLNLSSVREKRGDLTGALVALENYLKRLERQGHKPEWADARLKELRDKAAANPPKH
jgi:tetratricopeptide (TPR) repeat protein